MRRLGNKFKGSPSVQNSGEGEYEIITELPDNTTRSFYKFEFSSKLPMEVLVRINGSDAICLPQGYFANEPYDSLIRSFIVVTPNVDFYWMGGC